MKKLIVTMLALTLCLSLGFPKMSFAEDRVASCTMTIVSDQNDPNHPAHPTAPCTEFIDGFYLASNNTFNIMGGANYVVEHSGQQFTIGIPSGQYTSAVLTVTTVLKQPQTDTGGDTGGNSGGNTDSNNNENTGTSGSGDSGSSSGGSTSSDTGSNTGGDSNTKQSTTETKPKPKPAPKKTVTKTTQPKSKPKTTQKSESNSNHSKKPVQAPKKKENQNEQQALNFLEDWIKNIKDGSVIKAKITKLLDFGFKNKVVPDGFLKGLTEDKEHFDSIYQFFQEDEIMKDKELDGVRTQLESVKAKVQAKNDDQKDTHVSKKEKSSKKKESKKESKGFFSSVGNAIASFFKSIGSFFSNLF